MLAYDDYDSNKAEAPANFVPAAAVIRKGRVLFAWTGRKGRLGGRMKLGLNPECGKPFGSSSDHST